MIDQRLRRLNRLTQDEDIRAVLRKGKRSKNSYSSLFTLERAGGCNAEDGSGGRFTVILKQGVAPTAPKRNRLKRCIREAYRKNRLKIGRRTADRILVISNRSVFSFSSREWTQDFLQLLETD